MKKILLATFAVLALTLVITSCSTTKGTVSNNISRGKFVGTWTLNTVTYDGLLPGAVQDVFNQAPPQAFAGSTWQLTNSGNGLYTLTSGASQTIFWSVYNGDGGTMFQFKKLYQGDKAQHVEDGYRLEIASINGSAMVLKSAVAIGNGNGYIVYSFTKN